MSLIAFYGWTLMRQCCQAYIHTYICKYMQARFEHKETAYNINKTFKIIHNYYITIPKATMKVRQ